MFKSMRAYYYYIISARLNLLRFRTGGVVVYRNATEMNSPSTDIRACIPLALHCVSYAVQSVCGIRIMHIVSTWCFIGSNSTL